MGAVVVVDAATVVVDVLAVLPVLEVAVVGGGVADPVVGGVVVAGWLVEEVAPAVVVGGALVVVFGGIVVLTVDPGEPRVVGGPFVAFGTVLGPGIPSADAAPADPAMMPATRVAAATTPRPARSAAPGLGAPNLERTAGL